MPRIHVPTAASTARNDRRRSSAEISDGSRDPAWSARARRLPGAENDGRPRLNGIPSAEPLTLDGTYSSWSTSSDRQLGHVSPSADRVFPIRSVVSVDPAQTPFTGPPRPGGDHDGFPGFSLPTDSPADSPIAPRIKRSASQHSNRDDQGQSTRQTEGTSDQKYRAGSVSTQSRDTGTLASDIFRDCGSDASTEHGSISSKGALASADKIPVPMPEDGPQRHITARFKHIVTEGGHAVITGRDGQTLQRCEDEPIHIPGAVQNFGLLISLHEEGDNLVVRTVSENSERIIGYTPQQLFQLENFTDILSEEQADNLLDHIDFIRDDEADPGTNGPEVFTITIKSPNARRTTKLWCAMHVNPSAPEAIICEFELDDDTVYPLVPNNAETPEPPEDTLHGNPTDDEFRESTETTSKPLRVLRSARKRKGEAAAMEVFNIMSQVQEQLANAPNLDKFLKILCGVVKELTGFHRVMVYQFDAGFNGRVVTELVDPRATKDLYKGLNFPASDIPKQAREMYKINKVRLLYDRDLETARLVCRTLEDLEKPLDLTFSYLRAMSPIHIKYLTNMAVRSSMSISINAFDELWGLIACHGYGAKGMRVSFPIRKMCRLIGDTASRNIERLSYASRLQARKLINTVPTEANPSGYIVASSDDLLKLFDADFGLLSIRGETKVMGKLQQSQEALAMLEYFKLRKINSVITSQDITTDFPDLRYQPGFHTIAGVLVVPLSVSGEDFINFFRKGQIKEVKWAGNPYEKFLREGTEGFLEPRKSFQTWSEKVVGQCREWTEEQIETAAVLCLVYGKFIEVWRQKEAALQSSQLTRLLLANSAHEVRTPLNAIINYLEIALEGALDHETRDNLAKSHSASKSLIYVINDLLDLTKAEEGQDLVKYEAFDLAATIHEAADPFSGDAKRKGIVYDIVDHPDIPKLVHGDQRRVRQAIANLVANAVQHTSHGSVTVDMYMVERTDCRVVVDIVVQDTGNGMSDEDLDTLFQDLEQVSSESDDLFPEGEDNVDKLPKDEKTKKVLGLGLAVVARIVRNMEGQLRLKSEAGKGSRFVMQLPFGLPPAVPENGGDDTVTLDHASSIESVSSGHTTTPMAGEVMLVNKANSHQIQAESVRRKSVEDVKSLSSFHSTSSKGSSRTNKSDVDRLIDAISEPLNVGVPESEELRLARSNSRTNSLSSKNGGAGSVTGISAGRGSDAKSQMHARPVAPARSKSQGVIVHVPEHLRRPNGGPAGAEFVMDNKTLLKAIRMPDEGLETSGPPSSTRVLFEMSEDASDGLSRSAPEESIRAAIAQPHKPDADHLQVLVAEDDPINSRIIIKRLERQGHKVKHTVNGEDCASAYSETAAHFDVVLMDMQMPIVDGLTSTKMIRAYEKTHNDGLLSSRAKANGRVPIIAVSASLVERERQMYIDAGFDGWILKPIDFKRLNVLLTAIVDADVRTSCLYTPGAWERGGWFVSRQADVHAANTEPSGLTPVRMQAQDGYEPSQPEHDAPSDGVNGKLGDRPRIVDEREKIVHDDITNVKDERAP